VANLDDHARLLYVASEQRLWGSLCATSAVLSIGLHTLRGSGRLTVGTGIAAGFFGLLLLFSRLQARRLLRRRR